MNATVLRDFMRRVYNVCRKELLVILKDPANRTLLLVPVIVQSLIFGYAATYDVRNVPYALLDQSRGLASTELVARLEGSGVFRRVATLSSVADIAPLVDSQAALMVVHMGPLFEQSLRAGEDAPLQVILDARNSTTAASAAAHLAGVVGQFNAAWSARHGGAGLRIEVETRAWFNPTLETRWYMLPALIAALSMLQTLMLTALSVSREREQGTFDQLLVTPHTPTEIMIGKSVPPILVGLTQATLVLCVALFWFRIPMAGSILALYAGLLLFMVASVGIGLAISALSANMQQAMLRGFVLLMPLMLLSGLTTPIDNMPEPMQWLTSVNPLRYGIHIVQRIYLEGAGLGSLLGDLLPLVLIAALTLPLGGWLFRHRLA